MPKCRHARTTGNVPPCPNSDIRDRIPLLLDAALFEWAFRIHDFSLSQNWGTRSALIPQETLTNKRSCNLQPETRVRMHGKLIIKSLSSRELSASISKAFWKEGA